MSELCKHGRVTGHVCLDCPTGTAEADLGDRAEYLNELFSYRDGAIYWQVNRGHVKRGDRAGGLSRPLGYRQVRIDGRLEYEHRVIWQMHYGDIPEEKQIDHINQDRSDNRLENLRCVSRSVNLVNRKSTGSVPHNGICMYRGKYHARLCNKHLGYFETLNEALAARAGAEAILNEG